MEIEEGQAVAPHNGTEVIRPDHSYSWQASEFIYHEKPAGWYAGLWAIAAALSLVLGLTGQWLAIGVVTVMALAIAVYSRKQPRTLDYTVDGHGVSVDGKLRPYRQFLSFSIHPDLSWASVDLEPAQRLTPRLTLLCGNDQLDRIEAILSDHLPKVQRAPDLTERLARYLKF